MNNDILDRTPPFSLDAETAVIGSVLLDPILIDEVALHIRPDDFYDDAYQRLWELIVSRHDGGKKLDMTLLVDDMKVAGIYEQVGGEATLMKIVGATPVASHAVHYAKVIQEHATRRGIIDASSDALQDAYNASSDIGVILSEAQDKLFTVADRTLSGESTDIRELLGRALDELDARCQNNSPIGVQTGFSDLDHMLGGLRGGNLVIVGGRPGMGKSAFVAQVAMHAVEKDHPTLLCSLEMSDIELADRMLCGLARVNSHRARSGTISNDDRHRIVEKASEFSQRPLVVVDQPNLSVSQIGAHARRMRRKKGLGLIVVDYLQLISPDNPRDPREQQVSKIARNLKALARTLEVPVVCAAQLNRRTEEGDKRPKLSMLRESGSIEQDSDVVMFVHRPEYYDSKNDELTGKAEIIVAKQRNGPVGDVELIWRREFTRFEEKAPERFSQFDEYNDTRKDFQ